MLTPFIDSSDRLFPLFPLYWVVSKYLDVQAVEPEITEQDQETPFD